MSNYFDVFDVHCIFSNKEATRLLKNSSVQFCKTDSTQSQSTFVFSFQCKTSNIEKCATSAINSSIGLSAYRPRNLSAMASTIKSRFRAGTQSRFIGSPRPALDTNGNCRMQQFIRNQKRKRHYVAISLE